MRAQHTEEVYWADGAGSRAVFDSLHEILTELRAAVHSDRAVALYRPASVQSGWFVLSDSCRPEAPPALSNEVFLLNRPLGQKTPTHVTALVAKSTLRPFLLSFTSALAIPWSDVFGHGVVLIGVSDGAASEQVLGQIDAIADTSNLVRTLSQSRLSGTLTLERQVSAALRESLAANMAAAGPMGRLSSLVATARDLLQSDTAYLALPEEGNDTHYFFASFSNVTTPQFRKLRMSFGQGLGGLARREGRVVTSMNYAQDERLVAAPVTETVDEGIMSAVAAPLIVGSDVLGVLYVGSRSPRPYSETDELVLAEFANDMALMMDLPEIRTENRTARLTRMREDFAHAIHDSVVRSLVQIGFTAEQAACAAGNESAAASIDTIRRAAEEALTNLRRELNGIVVPEATAMSVGQVLEQVTRVPARVGVSRDVLVFGSVEETTLPASIAEVLIQIGAEALTNSLKHSECSHQAIEVTTSGEQVVLSVSDDGRGSPLLCLEPSRLSGMGHLGLASMHRRARRVGAQLAIDSGVDSGTIVRLIVPRTW